MLICWPWVRLEGDGAVVIFEDDGQDAAEASCVAQVHVGVSVAGAVGGGGVDADFVVGVVEGVGELLVGVFGEGGSGFDDPSAVVFVDVFLGAPVVPAVEVGCVVVVSVVEVDGLSVLFHEGAQ